MAFLIELANTNTLSFPSLAIPIILGGFGNVNGTILGALLIGMIQSLGAVYISNAYSTSIAFGLLVLTLIFFPRGLVPERVDENV